MWNSLYEMSVGVTGFFGDISRAPVAGGVGRERWIICQIHRGQRSPASNKLDVVAGDKWYFNFFFFPVRASNGYWSISMEPAAREACPCLGVLV